MSEYSFSHSARTVSDGGCCPSGSSFTASRSAASTGWGGPAAGEAQQAVRGRGTRGTPHVNPKFDGLFTAGPAGGAPPSRAPGWGQTVEEDARRALREGNFARAAGGFRQALRAASARTTDASDPAMPRLQACLSEALMGAHQYADALRAAEACLALDPLWHEGHACRARALAGLGQWRRSADAFDAARNCAARDGSRGTAARRTAARASTVYEQEAQNVLSKLQADVELRKHAIEGSAPSGTTHAPEDPGEAARRRAGADRKERLGAATEAKKVAADAREKRASTAVGARLKAVAAEARSAASTSAARARARPTSAGGAAVDDPTARARSARL
mmetsp:Transcript_52950/g.156421  ORF Transcript_52950/g.156421 Transcript_52950/m.156421 type:complete len:334 (-) Transcript_52950:11-1012(-)